MSKRVSVSKNEVVAPEEEEEVCVVCFRPVEIYSIGECDHPVCYECSTRMRVLCDRTECPICRKEMAKVVFTHTVSNYAGIKMRNMHYERRYAIYFETDSVMQTYDNLLEHMCPLCENRPVFRNFAQLKDHMRKSHERFYCELCVEHLRIFTHERRSYTRSQLALHRRKGDIDDRSHRGHPLCEFCDDRFMDSDDLFRHLRRDHFFCHFCDADGIHQYYNDYNDLRTHFRSDHYLCEEGGCQEEQFTSVFRTKLDLQAHCAQNHAQGMSRQAARQARMVDIEFTVNHRQQQDGQRSDERSSRGGRIGRGGRGGRGGRRERENEEARIPDEVDERPPPVTQQIDINCVQDFPSLNGTGPGSGLEGVGGGNKSMATHLAQQNRFTIRTRGGRTMNEEEFPSLGSTSVTVSTAQATAQSPTSPTTSVHLKVNTKKAVKDGQNTGQRSSNVSIQYNRTIPAAGVDISEPDGKDNNTKSKGAQMGVTNITLQSKANSKGKSKTLEEDFPALTISKTSNVGIGSGGWGSTVMAPQSSVSMQPVPSKKDFPTLGPSMGTPLVIPSKPGVKFTNSDFPTLPMNPESQAHMKNYHGRSSVTIPVNNAWTNSVEHIPKPSEPGENANGSKGKKKKKGGKSENNNNSGGQGNIPNGTTKPAASKKKPPGLRNIFDDSSDEDSVKTDLTMGKLGDYQSIAPEASSNVKMITSETLNERKKSELKIGSLQKPPPEVNSEEAFPSLGSSASMLTTSTWSSPAKRASAPPGFSSKPKAPPGFSATDMTFTSSSGEKFAISPSSEVAASSAFTPQPTASYTFHLPPNFELRNKALIKAIHEECQGNEEKFECFKQLAGLLRSGDLHGQAYYEQCRDVMGKPAFHNVLPELLVLLPDIKKQQCLKHTEKWMEEGDVPLYLLCALCVNKFSVKMTSVSIWKLTSRAQTFRLCLRFPHTLKSEFCLRR
ncbi:hypothetical protein SK128_026171 [Halocaridina rubra]|uniref:RING-type E3 ubiquitin transferase n=1 Tax=Halocaridina rubra TaxID=373956 RepID=A0AAN8WP65_HALRR